jgi:ATP-dependent Lon protease
MNGMIVDYSKIPQNLPKVLEEYNTMKFELSKLKGENLKLLGCKKRCEISEYYGSRQFEYYQDRGFNPTAMTNRSKLMDAEIQSLKTEKAFYVKMVKELRAKFDAVEADREQAELSNENLRALIDEKEKEKQRFVKFIQGKGISEQYEEFLEDDKNLAEIPRPIVATIRRRNTRTMRRLSLEQTMETLHECGEEDEEKEIEQ